MQFSEVIGQETVKQRLVASVAGNRVSHAQLFLGPEGCGNLALAIAYAQYISCTERKENDSCGRCASCQKYQKLVHPDLHFIYPISATKEVTKPVSTRFLDKWRNAVIGNPYLDLSRWYNEIDIENKQGFINADDCNDVIKKLSLKSFESEYKVMVIWRPERLFHSAAPKLLKILEEPPQKTLFLLVGENQEQILNTILSRTQLIKIKRIEEKTLCDFLSLKHGISIAEAGAIAIQANGNYTEARRLLESSETGEFNSLQFQTWMRYCFKSDWIQIAEWIEIIARLGRERQKQFIQHCIAMIRSSMLLTYGVNKLVCISDGDHSFARNFSPFVHAGNCMAFSELFNTAYFNIERNANPRILLFDLSMKISGLLKREKQPA